MTEGHWETAFLALFHVLMSDLVVFGNLSGTLQPWAIAGTSLLLFFAARRYLTQQAEVAAPTVAARPAIAADMHVEAHLADALTQRAPREYLAKPLRYVTLMSLVTDK